MEISAEGIAKRASTRRARLDTLVAEMFAAYQTGLSLAEVGRRFGGRGSTAVRNLFDLRGLPRRSTYRDDFPRKPDGSFEKGAILTAAEVEEVIASVDGFHVPPRLRFTWRKWSLAQRREYLARVRARLGTMNDRPTSPYSANVEPFDYGAERAHVIVRAANVGRDSRTKVMQIRTISEGVIFEGQLWFWKRHTGYAKGPLRQGTLVLLHHYLWSRAHGGLPVPRDHVIRFIDKNPNNLVPENLQLISRDQVARENQARSLTAKARQFTTALLERTQGNAKHETIAHLRHSAVRR